MIPASRGPRCFCGWTTRQCESESQADGDCSAHDRRVSESSEAESITKFIDEVDALDRRWRQAVCK